MKLKVPYGWFDPETPLVGPLVIMRACLEDILSRVPCDWFNPIGDFWVPRFNLWWISKFTAVTETLLNNVIVNVYN